MYIHANEAQARRDIVGMDRNHVQQISALQTVTVNHHAIRVGEWSGLKMINAHSTFAVPSMYERDAWSHIVLIDARFGFCGTTKDFCGDKEVERPSCSSSKGIHKVIGYYESWSLTERSCNGLLPEEIPYGLYTHIKSVAPTRRCVLMNTNAVKQFRVRNYQPKNLRGRSNRLGCRGSNEANWDFEDPST